MSALIELLVIVCAVAVLEWLIGQLPNPPVPVIAKQIAQAIVVVVAIIAVFEVLTGSTGTLHLG